MTETETPPPPNDANALLRRGHAYLNRGAAGSSRRDAALLALASFEEAVRLTRHQGDARAHALALRSHAEGLWAIGKLQEALEPLVEAAKAAERAGDPELAAMGLAFAAHTAELLGEKRRWESLIDEATTLAISLPSPFAWIYCRIELARGLARRGHSTEAQSIANEGLQRLGELPDELREALQIEMGCPLGDLYRHLGRPQEAVESIERTLAEMEKRQVLAVVHVGWRLLAEALIDQGEVVAAKGWLMRAIERAEALESDWDRRAAKTIEGRIS